MLRVLQTRRLAHPIKPFVRNYFIKPPKMGTDPRDAFPFDPRNVMRFTLIFGAATSIGFYIPIFALFYMKNKLG